MVYSLIHQLIWILPDDYSKKKDLSPGRFEALDRSRETLPRALAILEDLLAIVPGCGIMAPGPRLVVVIDGIQLCEDRQGDRRTGWFLYDFLEILMERVFGTRVKILFTADGICDYLERRLK